MLICWCHKVAHFSFCLIGEVSAMKSCERHLWINFFFKNICLSTCDNRHIELRAGSMGAKGAINQKMKEMCFNPFFVPPPLVLITRRSRFLCVKLDFDTSTLSLNFNSEKSLLQLAKNWLLQLSSL